MRVTVDSGSCVGAGKCVWAVPEVFDQSEDDGTVILLDEQPPLQLHKAVVDAEIACPSGAILVED
jgi:ferredoxin